MASGRLLLGLLAALLPFFAEAQRSTSAAKLPTNWKVCKRTDPNVNECLRAAILDALIDMIPGLPSLGVPTLDPFRFAELKVKQTTGALTINMVYTNLDLTGVRNIAIPEVRQDWDNGKLYFKFHYPDPLVLTGQYRLNANIRDFEIRGQGVCFFMLENVKAEILLEGQETLRNGVPYLHFDNSTVVFNTTRLTVRFEGLFDGNQELGDAANMFLNENWEWIFREIKPALLASLSEAGRQVANLIFEKVPVDDIAPR